MGRARGESNLRATLNRRRDRLVEESSVDRFSAVLGTTRGSALSMMTDGQRAVYRDKDLRRVVDGDGDIHYYNTEDKLHRETGPAVEWPDGTRFWYLNGEYHRVDGPAVERRDGTSLWYLNGERHRIGGPAVEEPDGTREWWQHGKLHRDDGPAIELDHGERNWYQNNKLHRIGGPAIERVDGPCEWYLHGERISEPNSV